MPRTRQSNSVRRIQIIEAAGKLIVKNGSENVTIRAIADEVGISEAAIYRHFANKKDVWLLLVNYIVDRLIEDIETSVSSDANALDILQTALNKHISAIEKRHGISFQVIDNIISVGDRELNKKVYALLQKYMLRLQGLIDAVMQEGWFDSDLNSAEAAQRISAIIQGLVNMWVLSNYTFDLKSTFGKHWTFHTTCMRPRQKE